MSRLTSINNNYSLKTITTMQEHGRIVAIMLPREGVSKRTGEMWKSQTYVMEIDGRYTRKVAFSLWGADRIQAANIQLGEFITMSGEVEAHEYNGNWYNEIRAYDIAKSGQSLRELGQQSANRPAEQPANGQQTQQYQGAPTGQFQTSDPQGPTYQPTNQPNGQQTQQPLWPSNPPR